MSDAVKNFAASKVAAAPSPASSGLSLTVKAGQGGRFPTPPFNATVWPAQGQPTVDNAEIVRVTAIVGDVLTLTRTTEYPFTPRAIVIGDQIIAGLTAKMLGDFASPPFPDNETILKNTADPTKLVQFDLSGLTTGHTRLLSVQDHDGSIVTTGDTGSVTNTMLAGSIANAKLSNSSVTVTAGAGLTGGGAVALGASISLSVPASGITNAMLAGSITASKLIGSDITVVGTIATGVWNGTAIANANLANSSVTVTAGSGLSGGGAVALGAAVTLSIGAGAVTNTMLAGSIAASKLVGTDITILGTIATGTWQGTAIANAYLANSSVTVTAGSGLTGGGAVALGASISLSVPALGITNAMLAGSIAAAKLIGTDITILGTVATGTWQGTAIANAYLANSSVTVTAGSGLTGGGAVSLGGSTSLSISAGAITNAMLAGGIAASKLIGTDITVLGTVTTGTWNGTAITNAYLANSSVTVTAGSGLSGGGSVSLGGTITLTASVALSGLTDTSISSPSAGQVLKYNGALWVNSAEADPGVNAGSGVHFYYDDTASDISTYLTLNKGPENVAETLLSAVANNGRTLIKAFASASAGLGGTQIDAGQWVFDIYAYVDLISLGTSSIDIDVYSRTSGGTETLLFNLNSGALSAALELYTVTTIQQAFSIAATDRLVIKVYAKTTAVVNRTCQMAYGGTAHYSNLGTPLVIRHNDLVGLQGGSSGQYYHLTSAEYTGTGSGTFVRQSAPTITGHPTVEGITSTGATGTGKFVFDASPTLSGHPTVEGVTSTGATGTGKFVFDGSPSIASLTVTGHPTIEGVTSTGSTGVGKFVFDTGPLIAGATMTGDLLFTDALYDIGKVGATRPRDFFLSRNATVSGTLTVSSHVTVEGVVSTGATGTGKFVFDASPSIGSPTITGHATIEGVTLTGATGTGRNVFDNTPTLITPVLGVATATSLALNGAAIGSNALAVTGHVLLEGVTTTGATGTGKFVFDASPTITGHATIEGVTATGATGTGKFVFDASPTITGHATIEGVTATGATGTGKFVFDTTPTIAGATMTGDLLFTDATYDIGKATVTRPRDLGLSRTAYIGTSLVVGATAFASGEKIEANYQGGGTSGGYAVAFGPATGSTTTEGYFVAFSKTSTGVNTKIGVLALRWTDTTNASGYASANIHSSYMVAGVQTDDIWLCGWGNHGAAFWPADLTSSSAPGANILMVNGTVKVRVDQNGSTSSKVQNFTSNTVAYAQFAVETSGEAQEDLILRHNSAGFTTVGQMVASGGILLARQAGGLTLSSSNAAGTINFWTAGTKVGLFGAAGGFEVGAPTGGDKGSGTINTAGDIYKNNAAYTNPAWVFEHYYAGHIQQFADRMGNMGLAVGDYSGLRPLPEVEEFTRKHYELPLMLLNPHGGLSDRGELLMGAVEESYLYLFDHEKRLRKLEELLH